MGLVWLGEDATDVSLTFGARQEQSGGFLPSSVLLFLVSELVFGNGRWCEAGRGEHKHGEVCTLRNTTSDPWGLGGGVAVVLIAKM